MLLILIYCSPPRKSLVKGERFIRFEEEQEFIEVFIGDNNLFILNPLLKITIVFSYYFEYYITLEQRHLFINL